MKKKLTIYSEAAYMLGLLLLALGTAFMERADFGVSMVVAPAYLLYIKISQKLVFFTFGMAEYCLQAVILVLMIAGLRQFKVKYLFSVVSAVIYGLMLDGCMFLVALLPGSAFAGRVAFYLIGMLLCSLGISFLFHTYLPPEVYELMVKEISAKYKWNINKVKTVYDCTSCLIAVIMSFAFFGFLHFEGVKAGTVICALINGTLIGICSRMLEKGISFKDAFVKKNDHKVKQS